MTTRRYAKALFLFRRDLRVDDNLGLAAALEQAHEVVPCVVFDPRESDANPCFSVRAFAFMLEAQEDLDAQLHDRGGRLHRLRGEPHEVVQRLLSDGVDAVFACRDYTPFARRRDAQIAEVCESRGVPFVLVDDALLTRPEDVRTGHGTPYRVFTAFHKAASRFPVAEPRRSRAERFSALQLDEARVEQVGRPLHEPWVTGGRSEGRAHLAALASFGDYASTRDALALPTTGLSAYLAFGCLSVREVYSAIASALGPTHALIRQLYWRDFFTHLAWHAPRVFGEPFVERCAAVLWDDAPELLRAWQEGMTGFPLVDAGMRQLALTGFMHNRARMVTASFLVKDLHIDWRLGERHFARMLVDFDPCVNNGNWQWAASTGADAQPYFRIFNPWLQQERHDPQAAYVRTWVEELRDLPAAAIHALGKRRPPGLAYPKPIVVHAIEAREAQERFRQALTA